MSKEKKNNVIRMGCIDASAIGLCVREAGEGEPSSRTITGRVIAFDSPSVVMVDYWDGAYREYVEKGAINEEQMREWDVKMTAFHDREILLARHHPESAGKESTLKLELREDGVWATFDAPRSPWGDNVLEAVRRGDMNGMSYSYYETNYKYRDAKGKDGIIERRISEITDVFEMTVTDRPAYPDAEAQAREAAEAARVAAEAEAARVAAEAKQREANIAAIRRLRQLAAE